MIIRVSHSCTTSSFDLITKSCEEVTKSMINDLTQIDLELGRRLLQMGPTSNCSCLDHLLFWAALKTLEPNWCVCMRPQLLRRHVKQCLLVTKWDRHPSAALLLFCLHWKPWNPIIVGQACLWPNGTICSLNHLLFCSFRACWVLSAGRIGVNGRSHVRTSTAILDKQCNRVAVCNSV